MTLALWQITPSGVAHVGSARDVDDAIAKLRKIDAPCVAFDDAVPVAASGCTSAADRERIRAVVRGPVTYRQSDGLLRGRGGGIQQSAACEWPACRERAVPYQERLAVCLRPFCRLHRARLTAVQARTPEAIARVIERRRRAAA